MSTKNLATNAYGVCQALEHVGAVVQRGHGQSTLVDRLRSCVLLGFGSGVRTQPVAVGQANVAPGEVR